MSLRSIVFVQYTNPAGYPPLAHASRILADRGWDVLFLGTDALGASDLRFEPHARIEVKTSARPAGRIRARLHYLGYCAWVAWHALTRRPAWIYASDPFSALPARVACVLSGARVVYHEHDSPGREGASGFASALLRFRNALARRAAANILPSEGRIPAFLEATGAARDSVLCVWNCPSICEGSVAPAAHSGPTTWLHYHGSINDERMPIALAHALADLPASVGLRIAGYETLGSQGYVARFLDTAASLGVAPQRIDNRGVQQRGPMLALATSSDIGVAFMPLQAADINMRAMVGASNKSFEYMLCGLPQLVSALPEWIAAIEQPGYGISCDPRDSRTIAAAVARLHGDRALRRRMGAAARARILSAWNYEAQFAPVLAMLEGGVI